MSGLSSLTGLKSDSFFNCVPDSHLLMFLPLKNFDEREDKEHSSKSVEGDKTEKNDYQCLKHLLYLRFPSRKEVR